MDLRDFMFLALFLPENVYILGIVGTPKIKISGLLPVLQGDKTFDLLRDPKLLAIQPARRCPEHQQGQNLFV